MKIKKTKVTFVSILISMGIYYSCETLVCCSPRPPDLTDKAFIAQYIYARPSLRYDITSISYSVDNGNFGVPINSEYTVVPYTLIFEFDLCDGCNRYFNSNPFSSSVIANRKEYLVSFENRISEWDALRKYHKDTIKIPGIEQQFFKLAVADTLDYIHITADRKYLESHTANPYYMDDIATVSLESAGMILREYHELGKYTGKYYDVWNGLTVSNFNNINSIHKVKSIYSPNDSIKWNLLAANMSFYLNKPPYGTDTFQFSFHWRYKNGTEYKTTLPRLIITR
ncbi:MAG: hypothetical protein QM536_09525 [Chitinophagaceae bacterium]|nr:hypothetical protein [Chitinophagaceae bacterium]